MTATSPTDVSAYPAGCSPAGVCDLVGNTWEMTDMFEDQHDRVMMLVGGAHYQIGGIWYYPNARRITEHQKAFLLSPGFERAATVGFRCMADSTVPVGRAD